jgi:hypothetical protein
MRQFFLSILFFSIFAPVACIAGARAISHVYMKQSLQHSRDRTGKHGHVARGRDAGMHFNEINFRHELEIGITDRLLLGRCPTDWAHRSDENSRFSYHGGAVGLIYNLRNPLSILMLRRLKFFLIRPRKLNFGIKLRSP